MTLRRRFPLLDGSRHGLLASGAARRPLLPPASYAELIAPATLNDGTPLRYGMGVQVGPDPTGLIYIGHGGRAPGFWVEVGWYPEARMAVVVMLNNVGPRDPQEVVTSLADEVLGWTMPPPS